jgi:hypothetical protein
MTFLRKTAGLLALAGLAAGAAILVRRRVSGPRERVDLYYDDGAMASLDANEPDTARLLAHARDALAAARSA